MKKLYMVFFESQDGGYVPFVYMPAEDMDAAHARAKFFLKCLGTEGKITTILESTNAEIKSEV